MSRILAWDLAAASICYALFMADPPATAQTPDPRVTKIVEEWMTRQAKFDAIRYAVLGQTTYVKGSWVDESGRSYSPPKPSRDFVGKLRWDALFDFRSHRYRWEVDNEELLPDAQGLERVLRVRICDGRVYQGLRKWLPGTWKDDEPITPANLDMTIVRGNLKSLVFEGGSLPLFHAHGIVPTSEDELYAGHLRRKIDPAQFYVHGKGVHGGRPCLVLRTEVLRPSSKAFHEFWVDLARQAAIVRYAYWHGGEVDNNYDVRYDNGPDGWMPTSWTYTSFLGRRTHTVGKFEVATRLVAPPLQDEDFHLEVRPGMRVREVEYRKEGSPPGLTHLNL